tara:strand:+ start:53 stop:625 length:573 start_codon:yes stop_codon:yes gene_type:complete
MGHPSGAASDALARAWQKKGLSDWLPSGWGRQGMTMQEELFRQAYVPEQYRILNKTVDELDKRWGAYGESQTKFKESMADFARRQEHFADKQKVWGAQLDEYLNKPKYLDVGGGEQIMEEDLTTHIEGREASWAEREARDLASFKQQAASYSAPTTEGVQWRKAPTATSRTLKRGGAGSGAALKISGVNV